MKSQALVAFASLLTFAKFVIAPVLRCISVGVSLTMHRELGNNRLFHVVVIITWQKCIHTGCSCVLKQNFTETALPVVVEQKPFCLRLFGMCRVLTWEQQEK